MRTSIYLMMLVLLASSLSACGNKGKLKSPTQIEIEEQKQKAKQDKKKKPEQAPVVIEEVQ